MKLKHLFYLFVIGSIFNACNLEGVEDDELSDEKVDSSITVNSDTITKEEQPIILEDSIDGKPNDMVMQRSDGLRIEWTIKKDKAIQDNDVVMVNYNARVAAGEEYDSNQELGEPVPLKLGIGMMVKGWEEGLKMMHIGDEGRIMIPAALGYGENGYRTIVPPDADLIVDIEIVKRIEPVRLEDGVKVYKWKKVDGGKKPSKDQVITFDYFAYKKGKEAGMYDNSYQKTEPFSFKYKNDNVMDGLHIGMSVIKASESAFIEIPAKLAYGSNGLHDLVPPNTDVVYDVRVESIE